MEQKHNYTFSKFLNFLSENQVNRLENNSEEIFLSKRDCLFDINTKPNSVFFIIQGKVKLSKMGINNKEQIFRLAKTGDMIGYRSLLSEDKYRLAAYCIEDTKIKKVRSTTFVDLLKENFELLLDITKKICDDLRIAEEQILSMSQKNVRERLAESLLFFKETYGLQDDNKTINISFSRQEIANYVGTSTESVIRLLSEFNADNIVKLDNKKIIIVDEQKLIDTANYYDDN